MTRRLLTLLALLLLCGAASAENWPGWRGPTRDGVSPDKRLPSHWTATKNVRWKAELPGAGVSAPIVWGERVFVTASDGRLGDRLHVLCFHRDSGKQLWHARFFGSAVSEGQFAPGGMAVPTPATDGKRVFALFGTGDLVCVDVDGRPLWVRSLAQEYGPFRNRWGMAASPALCGDLLVVQVDHPGASYLLGVDPATGTNRWRTKRDTSVNWSSPLPVTVGKKRQIVAVGTYALRGYAADTGDELWSVHGLQMQCIPTPVATGERLFVAGGRNSKLLSVRLTADARGDVTNTHVAWTARSGTNIPSPLVLDGLCYCVEDSGFANCFKADDGERVWRERLGGGKYSASPVAGDGKVYFASESGRVTVVRAGSKFEVLARNDVGESVVASPALSQGCLFLRGDRHLYCIAEPVEPGAALPNQSRADERDQLKVGVQPDGRIVVPTNQILKPAGKQVTFPGRPVDLALMDEGRTLVIKNKSDLIFLDVPTARIKQTLTSPVGFSAVGLVVRGSDVYVSDSGKHVRIARQDKDGRFAWLPAIELVRPKVGGDVYPTGLSWHGDEELWAASSRGNSVQINSRTANEVEQIVPVGVAPYAICFPRPDRCYVSNWGGDPAGEGELHAPSSGTPVRVDPRGIANHGTITVLEPAPGKWRRRKSIRVGLHPSGMIAGKDGRFVYVANANSDTVSVIDTDREEVVETIGCRPQARLPFGSGANALALSPDGGTLYVANGTNNCIAVVRLGARARMGDDRQSAPSIVAGLIPTGWYPGSVVVSADGKKLFVANVKGHGSLSQPRPVKKGKNSHDHLGSVSIIDVPDAAQLARYTAEVNANNRLTYSLAGLEKPDAGARPVPIPRRHGEPSVIKHVIYVIKENRTYDQVFGDVKEGDGDPALTIFGEKVTPNQHALARQFTLFDNFYCSGVLSADGHQWVNEAYVTDYLEKAFGHFTRSYPYEGSDPLACASSGFLWDNALARKKTFRNYGEFVKATLPKGTTWSDVYNDCRIGAGKIHIEVKSNVHSLAPFTRPGYPGFLLTVPDVRRAQLFIDDLHDYERKGEFPHLTYLYLPCDHTSGTKPGFPTPAAQVADNDLALGRVVEAVSKSKFWKDTCIFVVEDDPQNGFDHVDAHRTVALVISPYVRRGFVDHTNYNQTGMVKTIELILGLPPMNQLDLSATPMRRCFQDTPNLTPYTCRPNQVPLDQMNPPLKKLQGQARHWAEKSLELDLDDADEADEDTLNRILWHAMRGSEAPYPQRFAGQSADR